MLHAPTIRVEYRHGGYGTWQAWLLDADFVSSPAAQGLQDCLASATWTRGDGSSVRVDGRRACIGTGTNSSPRAVVMTVEREKGCWSLSWSWWSWWECGEGNVVFQKPLHGTNFAWRLKVCTGMKDGKQMAWLEWFVTTWLSECCIVWTPVHGRMVN